MFIYMKRDGFSFAEMLIVMVILIVVSVAAVPMIGAQKMKRPIPTKSHHGVVECYYEGGQLHRYERNNTDKKNGEHVTLGDAKSCEFVPPSADFYTVQLIGAGGPGYDGTEKPSYNINEDSDSGLVFTSPNLFGTSIKTKPLWVQLLWDTQWEKAAIMPYFTFVTKVGKGGDGLCKITRDGSTYCEKFSDYNEAVKKGCITYDMYTGGHSSSGSIIHFMYPIKKSDAENVPVLGDNIFRWGDLYVQGPKGLNGGNATEKPLQNGSHAESDNVPFDHSDGIFNAVRLNGQKKLGAGYKEFGKTYNAKDVCGDLQKEEGIATLNPSGEYAKDAGPELTVEPTSIPYSSTVFAIKNVKYGTPGKPGNILTQTFERFPTGTLLLTPQKAEDENGTSLSIRRDGEAVDNLLVVDVAKKGELKSYDGALKVDENTSDYFPFLKPIFPDGVKPLEISEGIITSKFGSEVANLEKKVGTSGTGSYPILQLQGKTITYKINDVVVLKKDFDSSNESINENTCQPGVLKNNGTKKYCSGTLGQPGAVIIIW